MTDVAVVTGGGSGIGRASAAAFAQAGAHVVVADVDEDGGAETVASLGVQATFVHTDVADPDAVDRLFAQAGSLGRIRSVHNNAGVSMTDCDLHEIPTDVWEAVLGTNLRGAWLVLARALAAMQEGGGAIVNTASVAGLAAVAGRGPYCASKAALLMLTRVAALENGGRGIRVNAVAPGAVETPLSSRFTPGGVPVGPPPTGRLGRPEEIAAAVVWLCSEAASYVNGACLTIDGGWMTSVPARFADTAAQD